MWNLRAPLTRCTAFSSYTRRHTKPIAGIELTTGSVRSFGNLSASTAITTNHFPPTTQSRQLLNFHVPECYVPSLHDLDDAPPQPHGSRLPRPRPPSNHAARCHCRIDNWCFYRLLQSLEPCAWRRHPVAVPRHKAFPHRGMRGKVNSRAVWEQTLTATRTNHRGHAVVRFWGREDHPAHEMRA